MSRVKSQGSSVKGWLVFMGMLISLVCHAEVSDPAGVFAEGNTLFDAGEFKKAAEVYGQLLPDHQSAAVLYNLGNAEYAQGNYAGAILHYEQARVLAPSNPDIRANLKLARDAAQVTAPELSWVERLAQEWPVNRWAWLAAASFWCFLALLLLPTQWGWRGPLRTALTVVAGVVLAVCLVGLSGYHHLGKLGVATAAEPALKLSPTTSAPATSYLKPGESAFVQKRHGDFYFVETAAGKTGWVSADGLKLVWE